jgi:hypothetical protein
VAGMGLAVGQHCNSDHRHHHCWWDQHHFVFVEQRRTGVREDCIALGAAIQWVEWEGEPVYREGISQELSNKTRMMLP